MRMIIIALLFLINPAAVATPINPPESDWQYATVIKTAKEHKTMCLQRARTAGKAYIGFLKGVTLEDQLAVWDEFAASDAARSFDVKILDKVRISIVFAYLIAREKPLTKPEEVAEFIYSNCMLED